MLTIACSSSLGRFSAVLDSGRLICTSGWSFLNVVETTKKISRMMRISTSETMMMTGARRFRTEKFMRSEASRASRDGGRDLRSLVFARSAPVIAFVDQLDDERFHLDRHHFHFTGKIGETDQCRHGDGKSEDSCV